MFNIQYSMINKFRKGFTLIELLVVIGVLAVIAAGVVALINPQDKLYAANDAKVQSDMGNIATAAQAYAATHNGFYPATLANMDNSAAGSGDLSAIPAAPTGYTAYAVVNTPAGCTAGTTCTGFTITGQLKSKKYSATTFWRWESSSGKACPVATAATVCP